MGLKDFEKAFIDKLRENLNEGYAIDTNALLKSLNYPPRKIKNVKNRESEEKIREKKIIEKINELLEGELIVVYEFIIDEAIKVIDEQSKWKFFPEDYLKHMETEIKNKLDRPNVRIVYDKRFKDLKKLFNGMNLDLYFRLTSERIAGNDLCLLMTADYEKTKVVSLDYEVCRVAFKYDVPHIDARFPQSFPRIKEKKSWKNFLTKKIQEEEQQITINQGEN